MTDALRAALAAVPPGVTAFSLPLLPGASAALTALALGRLYPAAPILVITAGSIEQESVTGDLLAFARETGQPVALLPAIEAGDADRELEGARLLAIRTLRTQPCPILVASAHALQQSVPDPDAVARATRTLALNGETALNALIADLVAAGYTRAPEVSEKGELAVRGGILDVWPATDDLPLRAEFADDRIESLRRFDPASQTSVERITEAELAPCSPPGAVLLTDLLPRGTVILRLDHDRIRQYAETRAAEFPGLLPWDDLVRRLAACVPALDLVTGDPPPPALPALPFVIAPVAGVSGFGDDPAHPDLLATTRQRLLAPLAAFARAGGFAVVCADTPGACETLAHELPAGGGVALLRLPLSGGFTLSEPSACALTLLAQPDLYAVRKHTPIRPKSAPATGQRLDTIADLQPGDRVVHLDHGIGRYIGTTEIEIDGRRSEVITLEYADDTKLHVPVSHVHLLSRYVGVGGHAAPLHRLGGKRWTREKTDAERAIADLAASLLDTQAKRQFSPGLSFDAAPPWMHAFEASFPYQETVDQARVIAEVKADMAAPRPMDRLVCGDAGYGKTEVAMRAAFIAVMNHRQVAVLVPTTVLAEQHYESFRERMAAYPLRIDVLSRFRTAAQSRRTLDDLAAGHVDIIIGTHALLQPGVAFQSLGLLVIDEEQRFGVRHKEYLKAVRQVVDVLTLSATPIPRTLYLSMTGARDMSLLQTPPRERLAIDTRVVRDSDAAIRAAILQELARDGQIFFLYNRVMTLPLVLARLERLVPEARIAVAHGQMPARELAAVMRGFESGETDLLLCTTIIESGLDIPRANTIIIHRADRFGIADLYQLRGRVGRASRKGYAWLLLPEHGNIDDEARERIGALRAHSGLGAGFSLALRDLEIRGSGSILGAAQSGHIAAIGFGLYCQLLKRTVARLKGEAPPLLVDVDIQLDFIDLSPGSGDPARAACLPYSYIEDEAHRIAFHRRVAEASTGADIRALLAEMADRFGRLPPPAGRLLRLAELRVAAAERRIARIEVRDGKVGLYRAHSRQTLLIRNRSPRLTAASADQKIAQLIAWVERVGV
jgi:transcription-repair coupling factor (superfamily II helicase)